MRILIKNAAIITMDNNKTVVNGYILTDGKKISAIGEGNYSGDYDRLIDAKDNIVMPGLINTHTHSAMTLMRGYAGGHDLDTWLTKYIFPTEDKMVYEDFLWGNMLAVCEMIKSGTTCCTDMYFTMETLVEAIAKSGMKANMSRCVQYFGNSSDFSDDIRLKEAKELADKYHLLYDGRIRVDISPHSVYLTTPEYLQAAFDLTREKDLKFHIHLSETIKENNDCIARFGKTPAKYLYDLGVLDKNAICAHCVHLTDEDMDILASVGASVAHNPASNLKLASGIAEVEKMRKKGINVALGTDGVSSNNSLDMIKEMYLAALLQKGVNLDASAAPTDFVFEMATVNGAKALGREKETGVLKPGMAADLIMINTDTPHMMPLHDIKENVLYSANGNDVVLTMVDGEILYENGEFKTIDIEEVKFNVNKCVERLF